MGRPKPSNGAGAKAAGGGRRRGPAATVADDFAVSESEEEQDDFKARRDTVSLSRKRPVDSDDDAELDDEVLGLMSDEEDEDEDDDDEGEDDHDADDDEDVMIEKALEKGGRMAELAKQAKAIGSKLKLHKKEDEDDEDESEQRDERWGGNKRKYYDADTADLEGSDADDALQDEEEEVMRLEKEKASRLKASDFGLDEDSDDAEEEEEEDEDEDEDEEATMGSLAKKKVQPKSRSNGHAMEVETVSKELGALSAEQREAALMADAPELLALLQDLSDSLKEVRQRIGPVLHEVRAGGLATAEGISYLEAKHILLLQYCTHIVFYILLKAEGRPVKDHPVIARLVELRAYLEKIRPIDKRLQYQVDRLIKAAQVAAKQEQPSKKGGHAEADGEADGDALQFGPRRDQLVPKAGAVKADKTSRAAADPSGVYRPPKINPVSMEGDEEGAGLSRNESRLLKEARRKASRSDLVRELAEEVVGAPRELRAEVPGYDSLAAVKHRQKMEARASLEEDMMTRVPLSKEENKKMKLQQRSGMSGKSMMDDFADEVADIVGMSQGPDAGGKGSRLADLLSRQKVSQKFGAEMPRVAAHGGDEDLPRREALHTRRVKYDSVAARHAAAREGPGSDDDVPDDEFFGSGGGKRGRSRGGEEDEVYQAAAAAAADRKRAKQEKYAKPATLPPMAEETTVGVRGISQVIDRNRGLTPHRRKDLKNPRKKHRIMFEKAQVRRKGAVQEVRNPTSVYGGEATGVKSRVVKSRKLG